MPGTARFISPMTQIIIGLIVLVPALDVIVGGRNLFGEEYFAAVENNILETVQRHGEAYFSALQDSPALTFISPATSIVVLLSLAVIVLSLIDQRKIEAGYLVLGGFLAYFVTNVLLPVPFGMFAFIDRSHVYPLLVFMAFFLGRRDGPEPMFGTAKCCLMVLMIASLVLMFAMPDLTRRVYEPEVRLPFIDFRLWGLGESANNIAPLAMTQIVLTMHRPFKIRALTILSYVSGGLVVLLAQSQTTWMISLVIIPALFFYQRSSARLRSQQQLAPWLIGACAAALALMLFAPVLITEGVALGVLQGTVLTGRPEVWNPAIETFQAHPIFGYGLLAWEKDFRQNIDVLWAVHAHSQLLQSLSVAGLVGATGLVAYISSLFYGCVKETAATRGLAPALFMIIMIRAMTEVPLSISAIMINDLVTQLLLFRLLVNPRAVAQQVRNAMPQLVFRNVPEAGH